MGEDGEYEGTRNKGAWEILAVNKEKFKNQDKHLDEILGVTHAMQGTARDINVELHT